MTRSTGSSVATIDQFLQQVGHVKTAGSDGTTPKSEPGSIGGETSHPVKKVDDRLQDVKKGERFTENTADVNEDQGAAGVQKAPEATAKSAAATIFGLASKFAKKAEGGAVSTPGSAADDHISTTTTVSATGEDPKNETNSAKAGKEDKAQGGRGGTTHPASTENDSLDGHKYASDTPLEKLAADMEKIGNSLLAGLHSVYENAGRQAPQATKTAAAQVGSGNGSSHVALQAGHELAGLVNGTFDKRAADAMVHRALTETIKQASDDADLFIEYAHSFFKQAEGEAEDPAAGGGGEDPMAAMGGGGGGGDPMAAMGGGGEGGGGGDPGAMLGALGGGEGAGDPMAGGGGGEGGDAEAQQLAAVLEQLGVTPEELQAAMEAEAAGGGGGGGDPMAGGGGGAPPMGGGGAPPMGGMETQANAGGRKTNLLPKTAAAEMGNYIRELAARTRGRK
jgi:hypothetical protein